VDHDPIVLTHARALLTSAPEGVTDYLEADLREPGKILAEAAQTLDFSRPVAIMLIAVLHLILDGTTRTTWWASWSTPSPRAATWSSATPPATSIAGQ
jgi:S-adenosyl methyltransferase